MRINDEVLAVLSRCDVSGHAIALPEQLPRKDYEAVNKVLAAVGAKWNKKAKAHLLPEGQDAELALDTIINEGFIVPQKDEFEFFPTPPSVQRELRKHVAPYIKKGISVLEPSAGMGDLVAYLDVEFGGTIKITMVEKMPSNADYLQKKYKFQQENRLVIQGDFTNIGFEEGFDVVLMNPPLLKGKAVDHIRKAYSHLKQGGILVAVAPSGIVFREDKKHSQFREELKDNKANIYGLPSGSFTSVGTNVNTVLVVMKKGEL